MYMQVIRYFFLNMNMYNNVVLVRVKLFNQKWQGSKKNVKSKIKVKINSRQKKLSRFMLLTNY